jgi:hypothetical protein
MTARKPCPLQIIQYSLAISHVRGGGAFTVRCNYYLPSRGVIKGGGDGDLAPCVLNFHLLQYIRIT